jgi:peptidoglycan/xylan/chitin deacetylase (PgdA/CDA1 family)
MIIVSSILRRGVYPIMSNLGLFSRDMWEGNVYALTYHGVQPNFEGSDSPIDGTQVSPDRFRKQLHFLKSRYEIISPEDFRLWCNEKSSLPPRAMLLTCDDGFINVLTHMVPILREEGLSCLFFITGESLRDEPGYLWHEELFRILRYEEKGGGDSLDQWRKLFAKFSRMSPQGRREAVNAVREHLQIRRDREGEPDRTTGQYRLLNRSELLALQAQGMTIGAHTHSHMRLSAMDEQDAACEIIDVKFRLESHLGRDVWALAYPFGDVESVGEREVRMAQEAGYTCAFFNAGTGCFGRTTSRFSLPRTHVTSEMTLAELEADLSGFHEKLRRSFEPSRS